jgi:AcrR family transcriptional regulator
MPKRLRREESQAQTRARLLEAAGQVFARKGYAGASVDAVAEEAGYSKGAVYSNFTGKEAIFLELMREHKTRELRDIETVISRLTASRAGSSEVIATMYRWLETMDSDLDWSLLAVELQLHARRNADFAEHHDALNAQHRARLGVLIARLFAAAGKTLPADPAQVASMVIALAQGLALERRPGKKKGGDPAGPLIGLVLAGLMGVDVAALRKQGLSA